MAKEPNIQLQKTFHVDFASLLEESGVGARRASAFLKIAYSHRQPEELKDFVIGDGLLWGFWPHELELEKRKEVVHEFRQWMLGECLKELDHHLSIFLDKCFGIFQAIQFHGQIFSQEPKIDQSIENRTNVAGKLKHIVDQLGIEGNVEEFRSLSFARNSLSHGAGIVRERHCNREAGLDILWVSPQISISANGKTIETRDQVVDMEQLDHHETAEFSVVNQRRTKSVALGEKIALTEQEVAEICNFYATQSQQLVARLQELAIEKLGTK